MSAGKIVLSASALDDAERRELKRIARHFGPEAVKRLAQVCYRFAAENGLPSWSYKQFPVRHTLQRIRFFTNQLAVPGQQAEAKRTDARASDARTPRLCVCGEVDCRFMLEAYPERPRAARRIVSKPRSDRRRRIALQCWYQRLYNRDGRPLD